MHCYVSESTHKKGKGKNVVQGCIQTETICIKTHNLNAFNLPNGIFASKRCLVREHSKQSSRNKQSTKRNKYECDKWVAIYVSGEHSVGMCVLFCLILFYLFSPHEKWCYVFTTLIKWCVLVYSKMFAYKSPIQHYSAPVGGTLCCFYLPSEHYGRKDVFIIIIILPFCSHT